ncbi:unnamed protein product [Rotaria magnacalcarata]|uniref:MD-2-related lipid-recognition domain-containing protein n=2 Tax=Rotaria magnacalcarata TaxID=392030 RepID=A0A816MXZ8_9BILA|nr:unnamed protein product [Rotaria magnacalcarata]CAF2023151.1 unnamed protein product [Rotaria magnacalcarata]CAF3773941.1 unnamed protein product [Rotaria magnacalcarata]CAF3815016.1 unnamed protein product [Rotaria magnacalcarata]CAF3908647.1 unnamed protein product [Rotaria magnacalcarata]
MYLRLLLFVFMIDLCLSTKSYTIQLNDIDLNSCNNANYIFDILSFNIWTDYLEIPGFFDCSLSFNLKQNYSAVHSTYSIQLDRKLGPLWMPIPCITDDCSEQSLCTLMKSSCSSKKSCTTNCQLSSGSHTLEHIRIQLKSTLLEHEIFTNGQYRFKIKFYDHKKKSIGCFTGYLTLRKNDYLL